MGPIEIIATSIGGLIVLFTLLYLLQFVGLYIQAWVSGAKVGFVDLVMMRFRKVKPRVIVENRITAKKAVWTFPPPSSKLTSLPADASPTSFDR